jgi:hypothetical protein
MADEFAVLMFIFDRVEILAYFSHSVRVTDRDHSGREFLRAQVQVVNGSPFI